MLINRLTRGQLSPFDTQRSGRGYPTSVNNIQPCPKRWLLMPLACVGARIATTMRAATRRERARPISAHAHWPSRQDNAVCMHAPRVCTLVLFINPRRACAARVTVLGSVCLSVCLSVKSHLTNGASVRSENVVTHSAGNEGQKFVGICLKPLRSRVIPRNISEKANMQIFPTYPRSAFSARHTAKRQRVPNDCQQHSALPKTMLTDAASPCWSEN